MLAHVSRFSFRSAGKPPPRPGLFCLTFKVQPECLDYARVRHADFLVARPRPGSTRASPATARTAGGSVIAHDRRSVGRSADGFRLRWFDKLQPWVRLWV